jgi:hypothetical protein
VAKHFFAQDLFASVPSRWVGMLCPFRFLPRKHNLFLLPLERIGPLTQLGGSLKRLLRNCGHLIVIKDFDGGFDFVQGFSNLRGHLVHCKSALQDW